MIRLRTYLLWLVLISIHTWLFFEQSRGFNTLVFAVIAVVLVTAYHGLGKTKSWRMGVGGYLMAAVAVSWHGNDFAFLTFYISQFLLAGMVFAVNSSLPVAFLNGLTGSFGFAFLWSVPTVFRDLLGKATGTSFLSSFLIRRAYLYVAPVIVTLFFYLLYSAANPDFFLDFELPAFEMYFDLLFFIFVGAVVLSPFVFSRGFNKITEWDLKQPAVQGRIRQKKVGIGMHGLLHEHNQGLIMFGMLTFLIAIFLGFNLLQIVFPSLYSAQTSHSEQVHQGFETLIMSIIAAILLIMYYFRGNQNFFIRKTQLIRIATVWLVLNGLLAMMTCYKNVLYVNAFGLTHLRIGVFAGIILTVIGLCLTLAKIYRVKTNWSLIRQNSWVIYFVIVSFALPDWDRLITWFNTNYAQNLDMDYIASLGNTKVPYLKELKEKGDPRVAGYEKAIDELVERNRTALSKDISWRSQTLDDLWMKGKLSNR